MGTTAPPLSDTTLNATLGVFESFQTARLEFAQDIAKLAATGELEYAGTRHEVDGAEKIITTLESCDTLSSDLAGLISDLAPTVQQCTMIALGRLCGLSRPLLEMALGPGVLEHVVGALRSGGMPAVTKAALFLLHSSTHGSPEAARDAVNLGVLPSLCERLELADPNAKSDGAWCLAAIAQHEGPLALAVAQSGALPLLGLCLKEPSLPLRRISLSCLGCIGQHDGVLAGFLLKEGILALALPMLNHRDQLLRRHASRLLAVCLQHLDETHWLPVDAAQNALDCLGSASAGDLETASFSAVLIGQLARRSKTLGAKLHELGAARLIAAHLASTSEPLPAAMALAKLCDSARAAAPAALEAGVLNSLQSFLEMRPPMPMQVCVAVCAALGAVSAADGASANAVAKSGALRSMVQSTIMSRRKVPERGMAAARAAVARAMYKCTEYASLVELFELLPVLPPPAAMASRGTGVRVLEREDSRASALDAPNADARSEVELAAVNVALIKALTAAMQKDGNCRYDFLQRGALTRVQEAKQGVKPICEAVLGLNAIFPSQMVKATDPDYETNLIAQVQQSGP